MGKNVDGGKKRKIYMGTPSLFLTPGTTFFFMLERESGVSRVYLFLSTAVYIFANCMLSPCL